MSETEIVGLEVSIEKNEGGIYLASGYVVTTDGEEQTASHASGRGASSDQALEAFVRDVKNRAVFEGDEQ